MTIFSNAFSEGGLGTFIRHYYNIDPTILASAPYELQQCPECKLVFQHFIGDSDLMRDLYTKWCWQPDDPFAAYPGYVEHLNQAALSPIGHELMAVSSFLETPITCLKVLDYGMGWALWIRVAAKLGCDAHGLELSQPQVEHARANGIKILTDTEMGGRNFHFINTEQVLEHVPNPAQLLRSFSESLAPGGILKVSVSSGEVTVV